MLIHRTCVRVSICVKWKHAVSGCVSNSKDGLTSPEATYSPRLLGKNTHKTRNQRRAHSNCISTHENDKHQPLHTHVHYSTANEHAGGCSGLYAIYPGNWQYSSFRSFPPPSRRSNCYHSYTNATWVTCENCTVMLIFKKNWLRKMTNKMQECLIGILLAEEH